MPPIILPTRIASVPPGDQHGLWPSLRRPSSYTGPLVGPYNDPLIAEFSVTTERIQPPPVMSSAARSDMVTKDGAIVATGSTGAEARAYRTDSLGAGPDSGGFVQMLSIADILSGTGAEYVDLHVKSQNIGLGSYSSYTAEIFQNKVFCYEFTSDVGTPLAPSTGVAGPAWAANDALGCYAFGTATITVEVWRWTYISPNVGTWALLTTFSDSAPSALQQGPGGIGVGVLRLGTVRIGSIGGGTAVLITSTPVTGTDSGSGTEASVLTAAEPDTDVWSETDIATLTALLSGADANAAVVESVLLTFLASVTDVSSGADASALVAKYTQADTESGADASSLAVALGRTYLGYTQPGTNLSIDLAGKQAASIFTAPTPNGGLIEFSFWAQTTASNGKWGLGIWSLTTGVPDALVQSLPQISLTGDGVMRKYTMLLTPDQTVALTAGTQYAFGGYVTGNAPVQFATQVGGPGYYYDTQAGLTGPFGAATFVSTETLPVILGFPTPGLIDTGSGSDSGSFAVSNTGTDTGAGSEATVLKAVESAADTSTDSEVGVVLLTGVDAGSDSETAIITVPVSGTDTASGTDASVEVAKMTDTDAATGTDASVQKAVESDTDSSTGADTATEKAVYTSADTTTDAETGAISQVGADTSSETDTATQTAAIPGSDVSAGTDAGVQTTATTVTDTSAGAEASVETAKYTQTDASTGTDSGNVTVPVAASDVASGSDASVETAAYTLTDTASETDTATQKAAITDTDSSVGAEASVEKAVYVQTDTGTDTENGVISVPVAGVDVASGADTATETAAITTADTSSGADSVSALKNVDLDVIAATDLALGIAAVSASDAWSGLEAVVLSASLIGGVTVTNLYTNGDFQTDVTGITTYGSGGAITWDNTVPTPFGTTSLKIVRAATAGGVGTSFIAVSPLISYTASFYVRGTPGTVASIRILERDSSVAVTTHDVTSGPLTMDGTWQRITMTVTTVAATAFISFGLNSGTPSATFNIVGMQLEVTQVGSPMAFIPTHGSAVTVSYGDPAYGTDSVAALKMVDIDASTGTDSSTLTAALSSSDVSAGTDSATVQAVVTMSDVWSGSDGATLKVSATALDSSTMTEQATLAIGIASGDLVSAGDLGSPTAKITTVQPGLGTDTATVLTPGLNLGKSPAGLLLLPQQGRRLESAESGTSSTASLDGGVLPGPSKGRVVEQSKGRKQ